MSSFKYKIKMVVERNTPYFIGKLISYIPYGVRLGGCYDKAKDEILQYDNLSGFEKTDKIVGKIKNILALSYKQNKFYRSLYDNKGYDPSLLHKLEDVADIPIVSKTILKTFELEDRSIPSTSRLLLNTGGTSGQPFDFYVDRYAFARHFAHYHSTWKRLGYKPTDLKLTFRGKNLSNSALHYNAVHNEYYVNAYCTYDKICLAVDKIVDKISFIHGYPSAIYQFVKYCVDNNPNLLEKLKSNINGIFFDSEFPAPVYRNLIEEYVTDKTLACYCHSEMAIMAYEIEKNVYKPHQTYGYCEAVATERGYSLVGTSFHNNVSSFIRYDTGDLVKPVSVVDGILEAFEIVEGRIGDFIEDKNGKSISLTALIFGRHHEIFNFVDYVQIRQSRPGIAQFILTASDNLQEIDFMALVDLSNIDIDFEFVIVNVPFRTKAGKVPLLVTNEIFGRRISCPER